MTNKSKKLLAILVAVTILFFGAGSAKAASDVLHVGRLYNQGVSFLSGAIVNPQGPVIIGDDLRVDGSLYNGFGPLRINDNLIAYGYSEFRKALVNDKGPVTIGDDLDVHGVIQRKWGPVKVNDDLKITGNIIMASGKTIDGVDISALSTVSAADIWTHDTRTLTDPDSYKADVSDLATQADILSDATAFQGASIASILDYVSSTNAIVAGTVTEYGLPKTGQEIHYGTLPDDADYADPAGSHDIGYPRGTGSWTNYNAEGGRFTTTTVGSDVVITDNATGLMWDQKTSTIKYNWEDAKDYCENQIGTDGTYAGYSDWRLPNFKELISIVDLGEYMPAIDETFFPGTKDTHPYWSSTTFSYPAAVGLVAWYVDFQIDRYNDPAQQYSYDKSNSYYVRCVRAGE